MELELELVQFLLAFELRQRQCKHLAEGVKAPVDSLGNNCGQSLQNETSGHSLRRTLGWIMLK